MSADATGTVVTFYSYKGGVGRTFALANTAAVLARWGYRVLCVDWDLDAPGLVHYLRPWLVGPPARGVVDLVDDHAAGRGPDPADYAMPVALPGATGRLDLLAAGTGDGAYVARVQQLDWAALYADHDLGGFLERCRARWTATYDVVLVDSRTGITDIGGICTAQLPDVLVMLFTANEQNLRGTVDVAERAWAAHDALPSDRGGLQILPVPSRFDARDEHEQATIWRARFAAEFAELVEPWAAQEITADRLLGYLTLPYISYWSFGERLPAVEETDPTPEGISYFLENLAAVLAHRLDRTELLGESRDSFVAAAARGGRRREAPSDIFLSAGQKERPLAGRLTHALSSRALRVYLPSRDVAFRESPSPQVAEALSGAAHLVVLVGPDGTSARQTREVERFLRQNLDEAAERMVIPVLTPDAAALPPLLAPFRARRLVDDGDEAVAALAATIARDVAARGGTDEADTVRADTLDTLADLTAWQLDPLRWQLVDQELRQVERAVDDGDDAELRTVTAELELLGPTRAARDGVPMPADLRGRVVTLITRLGGQLDVAAAREAVTARLDRFAEGDHEAVLGDAALAGATRYRLAAGADDPEAAFLLGLLHHLRSTLRADGGDGDRAAAVRDFGVVFRYAPDQVPPALRADVAAAVGDVGPDVRAAWAGRVTDLVAYGRTAPDHTALDDAVWLAELVLDRAGGEPDRIGHATNLVLALRARFRRRGDPADLDAAVEIAARLDDGRSGRLATAAGLALVDRYGATGWITDLDAAVERFELAVQEPGPAGRRSNLASALATRFLARGDVADLDRAVALLRKAVEGTPPGVERAGYQANLGAALATRYGHLGDGRDLDEAVACGRAAVRGLPDDDPDRVPALSGLGLALRTRYQRGGDGSDLDAAVAALDEALARAPAGPARAGIASNLSTALRVRAGTTGERADAERAVDLARAAVDGSPAGDVNRPRYLSNLGAALSATGRNSDRHEAVLVCTQAADLVGDHDPLRATVLANLGLALRRRRAATGDRADLESAAAAYRAAALVATAAPLPRAIAAQEWGDAAAELGAPEDAVTGYATALDLLGQVTDRRLAPPDQQRGLARLGGLGSAAAAAALTAGDPHRALELLEQGRGVLLAQALDTRGEPGALRAAHPELADRFALLAHRLNDPAWPDRRRLVAEWDDLLDDIRTRPGFERFLRSPTAAELIATVGDGLLVAVNVAAGRCDALVVAAGSVEAVSLPDLTYADAHARAAAFLDAVHGDDPGRDATVAATLGWLGETVAAPLLVYVGSAPRIWWVPTGPLAVLPLGCAEGRDHTLLGRNVVSSTIPSVRALAHARRYRPRHRRRTLVVAAGGPAAGLPALPAADVEAAEVATRFAADADLLTGAEATPDAVRDALPRHANGHFACHAVVDLADPSRSGLVLTGGTLTVREIQAVDHPDAGLAYLSACSTAFGGATLLDEAVHVAAAFQVAGYRHVVATMWPVGDLAARRFARLVYDALADGAEPAEAVHRAVVRTRDALPGRPSVWAAAVHIGP